MNVAQLIEKLQGMPQEAEVEICPHSIKSKSYKENGYPIEVVMDNATIPTKSKKV